MSDMKSNLESMKASIEQLRDEIVLKAHLGHAEARDELDKMEQKWEDFLAEYKPVSDEVEKTAESAGAALTLAAEEIKDGYNRIRKLF